MMKMKILNPGVPKLDYKDVLIVPQISHIESRRLVNLKQHFRFRHSRMEWNGVPIISSNMDSVTDVNTMNVLSKRGYLSAFPKHINKSLYTAIPDELKYNEKFALSCGINEADLINMEYVMSKMEDSGHPLKFLMIDVANGYLFKLLQVCSNLRDKYPYITLIAGNVVTASAVEDLVLDGGVDIVKVGIGSGAVCLTRKMTGVGYPQLSAIMECAIMAKSLHAHIISDGGITCAGDIAKAFVAGADFVMLGSYLAGHNESPGETTSDGHKLLYGMSSSVANKKHNGGLAGYRASEGRVVKIPCKGNLENTLIELEGGLNSACTYINAKNIGDMYRLGKFIQVNNQLEQSLEKYTISN